MYHSICNKKADHFENSGTAFYWSLSFDSYFYSTHLKCMYGDLINTCCLNIFLIWCADDKYFVLYSSYIIKNKLNTPVVWQLFKCLKSPIIFPIDIFIFGINVLSSFGCSSWSPSFLKCCTWIWVQLQRGPDRHVWEGEKKTSLIPNTVLLTNATYNYNSCLVGLIILLTDTEFSSWWKLTGVFCIWYCWSPVTLFLVIWDCVCVWFFWNGKINQDLNWFSIKFHPFV